MPTQEISDVTLRVYVVNRGDTVTAEEEFVLCPDCAPTYEAGWTSLGVFFDHVADVAAIHDECRGCSHA